MNDIELKSKIKGCLLAGATGDLLGYTVAFKTLSSIRTLQGNNVIQEPKKPMPSLWSAM